MLRFLFSGALLCVSLWTFAIGNSLWLWTFPGLIVFEAIYFFDKKMDVTVDGKIADLKKQGFVVAHELCSGYTRALFDVNARKIAFVDTTSDSPYVYEFADVIEWLVECRKKGNHESYTIRFVIKDPQTPLFNIPQLSKSVSDLWYAKLQAIFAN